MPHGISPPNTLAAFPYALVIWCFSVVLFSSALSVSNVMEIFKNKQTKNPPHTQTTERCLLLRTVALGFTYLFVIWGIFALADWHVGKHLVRDIYLRMSGVLMYTLLQRSWISI